MIAWLFDHWPWIFLAPILIFLVFSAGYLCARAEHPDNGYRYDGRYQVEEIQP